MKIKGLLTYLLYFSILVPMLVLVGCKNIHPVYPTAGQQIQSTIDQSIGLDEGLYKRKAPVKKHKVAVPAQVDAALLPPLSHYVKPTHTETPKFDVAANNTPAREFFMGLVAGTPYNMVVSPNITGNITLSLKNVTIHQTLQAVHDIYGYEFHRTSFGYEVTPPTLETRMFHINYLDVKRKGSSYMQLTTGQVSNKVGTVSSGNIGAVGTGSIPSPAPTDSSNPNAGQGTISSVETTSDMNFWKNFEKTLNSMIGKEEGHSVNINAQTGMVVIRAFPIELNRIDRYINSIQNNLNRQVILEAKILEVQLNKTYQAGIDWGILSNPAYIDPITGIQNTQAGMGQFGNQTFPTTPISTFNGIFTLRINGTFSAIINLLQTQGNVQVLSSPHISTVNNQKAVIKVGSDEFFVTGVSTTNSVVGTSTLPSQDVSLTPFFSGITLDVTPEISSEQTVILHIHPSVSKVTQQTKEIGLGASTSGTPNTLVLPLAYSTIRESDNIVRAKNGQVVVIGGLMQNAMNEALAATPALSNIPFLGTMFRNTQQNATKSELVILLRPIVVTNKTEIGKLQEEGNNMQMLQRPYHMGGYPLVFGNEAERAYED